MKAPDPDFGPNLQQSETGYRYSIEPFLLAHFTQFFPGCKILDVGTGCGIIPILCLTQDSKLDITGIEIQEDLFNWAVKNINGRAAAGEVKLVRDDFMNAAPKLDPESFDVIISNPPYRKINSGRINPNQEKAVARHELTLNLPSLIQRGAPLLKTGGKIILAYPPLRLMEALGELRANDLFPSRLWFIHGHRGAEAKIFLVEAVKGQKADCIVENPHFVYETGNIYTREMEEIYASFDHINRPDDVEEKSNGVGVG